MTNAKQYYALGFTVFSFPAVFFLPKLGWVWALGAAVFGAALLGVMILLHRRDPRPLTAIAGKSPAGKAVLVLVLLWNLLTLGVTVRLTGQIYPTAKAGPLVGLLLLLLADYAARKGTRVICRTGAIIFFFLAGFYALLFAFGLPGLQPAWLTVEKTVSWRLLPAVLAPVPVLFLCGEEKGNPLPWLTGGILLAVLAAVFCAGGLSPGVVKEEAFPFYTAAKSVSILGVMERMEALVSAGLTAGAFALLAVVCTVNRKIIRLFFPKENSFTPAINFFLGGGSFWVLPVLPAWILPAGTTIFWGFIPLTILIVANTKDFKKI